MLQGPKFVQLVSMLILCCLTYGTLSGRVTLGSSFLEFLKDIG
jgi:hypothetical protein